jgi:hypothetical protein
MATIEYLHDEVDRRGDHCHLFTWPAMAVGDIGQEIEMPGSADRSVQLGGTFGVGGEMQIEGSNDKINFLCLTDAHGNRLRLKESRIEAVTEVVRRIRPRILAGDGTTALTVTMLIRRPSR